MSRSATSGTGGRAADVAVGSSSSLYLCALGKWVGEEGKGNLKRPNTFSRVASADFFIRFRPKSPPDSRCRSAANSKRHGPIFLQCTEDTAVLQPSLRTLNTGVFGGFSQVREKFFCSSTIDSRWQQMQNPVQLTRER